MISPPDKPDPSEPSDPTGPPADDDRPMDLPLPRLQTGFPPQHLLVTLIGEHLSTVAEPIPSTALVAALADFGISASGARAAISRLSRRGVLAGERQGRSTWYQVTDLGRRALALGKRRLHSFTPGQHRWDGQWTFVAFSIPEADRSDRSRLRVRLGNLGLAPLYDGLWVTPHTLGDEVADLMTGVGTATYTIIVGTDLPGDATCDPLAAWDLEPVSAAYDEFVAGFNPVRDKLRDGAVAPTEALVERIRLCFRWFSMANTDPDLPTDMLPAGWKAAEATALFVETYNELGPLAALRMRQVLAERSPELAEKVTHSMR